MIGNLKRITQSLTADKRIRYAFLIDGEWYNSLTKYEVVAGPVDFEFKANGKFKNITKIANTSDKQPIEAYTTPEAKGIKLIHDALKYSESTGNHPSLDRDRLIVRQSCLKAAVETLKGTEAGHNSQEIKDLAKEYVKWIYEA